MSRLFPVVLVAALLLADPGYAQPDDPVAAAQNLVDAGRPAEALAALGSLGRRIRKNAEALLVRSTARFMLGEDEEGRADLDRALELDPTLRQGWLNRGAIELADKDYEAALQAFERAAELDPANHDTLLNLGVVRLLSGELEPAAVSFAQFLKATGGSAESHYLVSTNYALADQPARAIVHLTRAIELDERSRLQARDDPNFLPLRTDPAFRRLLDAPPRPPARDDHVKRFVYPTGYSGAEGALLRAVLDALQLSGLAIAPQAEVTPSWALILGDLRVLVRSTGDGRGLVEMSAPAERYAPALFEQNANALAEKIQARLIAAERTLAPPSAEPPPGG